MEIEDSNKKPKNDLNKYNIFNFNLLKNENKDYSFHFREIKLAKIYIISREDFDNGIKFLKNEKQKSKFKPNDIKFYHEFLKIKETSNKNIELSLVTKEFLKELEI